MERSEKLRLVTFFMGDEVYAVEVSRVREVMNLEKVVAVPNSPEFIEGVIEVREKVVPILDLRKKLGAGAPSAKRKSRIIVLEMETASLGAVVDDVKTVVTEDKSKYMPVPQAVLDGKNPGCVVGMVKTEEGLVLVLAPEKMLTGEEIESLSEIIIDDPEAAS